MAAFGETLYNRCKATALIWRFTRNNGITADFRTRMGLINRHVRGFHTFTNRRL